VRVQRMRERVGHRIRVGRLDGRQERHASMIATPPPGHCRKGSPCFPGCRLSPRRC
jgi:hypothetical protein